jgi:SAM-dependent methyltransferase
MDETVTYYARRAREYDRIYEMERWQGDLRQLEERTSRSLAGRRVFEAACGTGYWTRFVARSAAHVHAVDLNETTLAIARARDYPGHNVRFERRDAYAPADGAPAFDGGLAGFWLSHVDMPRLDAFLRAFHSHLVAGAAVVMFDERGTEARGLHAPASRTDDAGNRYEMRQLQDGSQFEIIKNFYDEALVHRCFGPYATDLVYEELEHLWVLRYRTRS